MQTNGSSTTRSGKANEDSIKIFVNLYYLGKTAEKMAKSCIKKLYLNEKVLNEKLILSLSRTVKLQKMSFFYKKISFLENTKDKAPSLSESSLVYVFTCPGCSCNYIGKTEWTLHERMEEHAYPNKKNNKQSATYKHLSTYPHCTHIFDLFNVNNHDVNTIALDNADNWNKLLFKEVLLIKSYKPPLNTGLKASEELHLF